MNENPMELEGLLESSLGNMTATSLIPERLFKGYQHCYKTCVPTPNPVNLHSLFPMNKELLST